MVANKLRRGFSWDLYTRSPSSNSTTVNSGLLLTEDINRNDAISNVAEPFVEWKNTFNMRQVTLENIAENGGDSARSKIVIKAAKMHGRNVVNAGKSLDLLRQNIQSAINSDIDQVIIKYLETYFMPAITNIRGNLGQGSVNEEHIRELCRTMLDEAKHLYLNSPLSRSDSPFNGASDISALIESRFGNSQDVGNEAKRLCMVMQRREVGEQFPTHKRKLVSSSTASDRVRITDKTLFIMASKASKVLGCGDLNGRLFLKHPELFRYCADAEDRDWLIKRKLLYVSQHSLGLLYVLILEDVRELLNRDCYCNNTKIMPHELKGFEAPEFMLKKIRAAITPGKTKKPCVRIAEYKPSSSSTAAVDGIVSDISSTIDNAQVVRNSVNDDGVQPTNVLVQGTVGLENMFLQDCGDQLTKSRSAILKEFLSHVDHVISSSSR